MNTLLLSAGMCRRLGYLTNDKPKCLIKIGDKPLIDIWIAKTNKGFSAKNDLGDLMSLNTEV